MMLRSGILLYQIVQELNSIEAAAPATQKDLSK
jgi:hypothetical protein